MSVIIRLQNLPWSANSYDIRQYFHGLSIPEGGVHIIGGELGDAFIAFSTDEDARQAMALSGGKLKEVKINLLLSSRAEMYKVVESARTMSLPPAAAMIPPVQASSSPPTSQRNNQEQPMDLESPKEAEADDRKKRKSHSRSRSRSRDRSRNHRRDRRRKSRSRSRERRRRDRSNSRSRRDRYGRDLERRDDFKKDGKDRGRDHNEKSGSSQLRDNSAYHREDPAQNTRRPTDSVRNDILRDDKSNTPDRSSMQPAVTAQNHPNDFATHLGFGVDVPIGLQPGAVGINPAMAMGLPLGGIPMIDAARMQQLGAMGMTAGAMAMPGQGNLGMAHIGGMTLPHMAGLGMQQMVGMGMPAAAAQAQGAGMGLATAPPGTNTAMKDIFPNQSPFGQPGDHFSSVIQKTLNEFDKPKDSLQGFGFGGRDHERSPPRNQDLRNKERDLPDPASSRNARFNDANSRWNSNMLDNSRLGGNIFNPSERPPDFSNDNINSPHQANSNNQRMANNQNQMGLAWNSNVQATPNIPGHANTPDNLLGNRNLSRPSLLGNPNIHDSPRPMINPLMPPGSIPSPFNMKGDGDERIRGIQRNRPDFEESDDSNENFRSRFMSDNERRPPQVPPQGPRGLLEPFNNQPDNFNRGNRNVAAPFDRPPLATDREREFNSRNMGPGRLDRRDANFDRRDREMNQDRFDRRMNNDTFDRGLQQNRFDSEMNNDRPDRGLNQDRLNQNFDLDRPNRGGFQKGIVGQGILGRIDHSMYPKRPERDPINEREDSGMTMDGPIRGMNMDGPNRGMNMDGPNRGMNMDGPNRGMNMDGPNRGMNMDGPNRGMFNRHDRPMNQERQDRGRFQDRRDDRHDRHDRGMNANRNERGMNDRQNREMNQERHNRGPGNRFGASEHKPFGQDERDKEAERHRPVFEPNMTRVDNGPKFDRDARRGPDRNPPKDASCGLCVEVKGYKYRSYKEVRGAFSRHGCLVGEVKFDEDPDVGTRVGVKFLNWPSKMNALKQSNRITIGADGVTLSHLPDEEFEQFGMKKEPREQADRPPRTETSNSEVPSSVKEETKVPAENKPSSESEGIKYESQPCIEMFGTPSSFKSEEIPKLFLGIDLFCYYMQDVPGRGNVAFVKFKSEVELKKAIGIVNQKKFKYEIIPSEQFKDRPNIPDASNSTDPSKLPEQPQMQEQQNVQTTALIKEEIKSEPVEIKLEPVPLMQITSNCICMTSLPFGTTDRDICDFFSDVALKPHAIHIMLNNNGRPSGDAFVEFDGPQSAEKAFAKNGAPMGRQNINITIVPREVMLEAVNGPEPMDFGPSNDGPGMMEPPQMFQDQPQPQCVVTMENVPFKATIDNILSFFGRRYNIGPQNVFRKLNDRGQNTGYVRVIMPTPDDAAHAVSTLRHRQLGGRNIRLAVLREM